MLYLVTNRHLAKDYYFTIEGALKAGVDRLILREKDLDYEAYLKVGKKLKPMADSYGVPLIVNGSLDLAKALDAFGYHSSYLEYLERGKLYSYQGVSVHSLEEAIKAESLGADYILLGHIFETDCKKGLEPRGLDFLREINRRLKIPVVAIGGIGVSNAKSVLETGVKDLALMSGIMESEDSFGLVSDFKKILLEMEDLDV